MLDDAIKCSRPGLAELFKEMNFEIRQVTWGYQDIFYQIICEFYENGFIKSADSPVTRKFFEVLSRVDKSIFDTVIKSYLDALRSSQRWVMRNPQLFESWSNTGIMLAGKRCFLGIKFFDRSATGQLGKTPVEIEFIISMIGALITQSESLVDGFIIGYPVLNEYLSQNQIRTFIDESVRIFHRNPETARKYLSVELQSARLKVETMSNQVRLGEEKDRIALLLRGILGHEVKVENLSHLDMDDIIERGTMFSGCSKVLYVPEVFCEASTAEKNMQNLKAMVVVGAACKITKSFLIIHGTEAGQCRDLFKSYREEEVMTAFFYLVEVKRVLDYVKGNFPGIRKALTSLVNMHFDNSPPCSAVETLAAALSGWDADSRMGTDLQGIYQKTIELAEVSEGWRDTAELILKETKELCFQFPDIQKILHAPPPFVFFPDMLFPLTLSTDISQKSFADLHNSENSREKEKAEDEEDSADNEKNEDSFADNFDNAENDEDGEPKDDSIAVGYFYDEWNNVVADYYSNWCCVREIEMSFDRQQEGFSAELHAYAERVRRIFEHLKPEDIREERRLLEGDSIHIDHFMEYISQGPEKQNTDMRFYNKPFSNKRDVAVSLLLDFSGSTGSTLDKYIANMEKNGPDQYFRRSNRTLNNCKAGSKTIIQIEKEAAFVLASGLHSLGDNFSIYGFTGSGRENCLFYKIKEEEEEWSDIIVARLLSAQPGSSTRMGPALRHAGWKLEQSPAKTKLLILITDGQPCDQGYDTSNSYAQHDVRKALQENLQKAVHSFCISTLDNSPADMELMFPNGRHQILEDISNLPNTLSHLYLKLTK